MADQPEGATGTDWTAAQNDLIIADYFEMLALELAGQPYNKAERNRALQSLTGRPSSSIERKRQNISAILDKLGEPWIVGFKPLPNYQRSLLDAIERSRDKVGKLDIAAISPSPTPNGGDGLSWVPPPPKINKPSPEPAALKRLIRKFDPASRDARNRTLGKLGEERVFFAEREKLLASGQSSLAKKVEWISETQGDGAGFDIRSFNNDGSDRLIEVKTTNGMERTPFFLSENERTFAIERSDAFRIVRLYDFARAPKAFEISPPIEEAVHLQPTNYRAAFH